MADPLFKGRFVIVSDEGDWSWTGHNHFYSVSVAKAAAAEGYETAILAPIEAERSDHLGGVRIYPYIEPQRQLVGTWQTIRQVALKVIPMGLSQSISRAGRSVLSLTFRFRSKLRPKADTDPPAYIKGTFGAQIAEAIRTRLLVPTDLVFIHTILTQSLESLLHALELLGDQETPRFRLTLRTDPRDVATRYGRRLELADILNRFWENPALRSRVEFLTDTEELKREYDLLSPFSFTTIPIPVSVPPKPAGSVESQIVITYVGAMRRERGFHLLPKLARHLSERRGAPIAKLVVQAGGAMQTDDPQVSKVLEDLKHYRNCVDLIIGSVPPDQYVRILHQADIVILPYDADRYRSRSSGVMAEALVLALPTVVPAGTWMARVGAGSCVELRSGDPAEALCRAVDIAIGNHDSLSAEATVLSRSWRRAASAAALFSAVLAS